MRSNFVDTMEYIKDLKQKIEDFKNQGCVLF